MTLTIKRMVSILLAIVVLSVFIACGVHLVAAWCDYPKKSDYAVANGRVLRVYDPVLGELAIMKHLDAVDVTVNLYERQVIPLDAETVGGKYTIYVYFVYNATFGDLELHYIGAETVKAFSSRARRVDDYLFEPSITHDRRQGGAKVWSTTR